MDKKVLLVADDDEMNRRIIRKFLQEYYIIVEAEDGLQTMEIIESRHIDALLLDIIMPEMDGLEVLRRLEEGGKLKDISVLVATSTKEKTERTALSLGADDVVSKPYDPIVIHKRLENILSVKELVTGGNAAYLTESLEEAITAFKKSLFAEAEKTGKKIHKYTEMINANLDNQKLVEEITKEIDKLDDKLISLLSVED